MGQVSDEELQRVIADFLDMGHVDNIVAMFRRDPRYYDWTGEISPTGALPSGSGSRSCSKN